jgi:acetylornithine aminotransferase/acetylornithine/N-succinyldiaminopimelate aminotransferase
MSDPDYAALEDATELRAYAKFDITPVRGAGSWVEDAGGARYLDMYGGHAVCLTGHCHPAVVAAIREQAGRLIFYSNTVRSPLRARASEKLLAHAPIPGSRVFYVNSGAEANETAMKLARRFTRKRKVVSFLGAFHGRTIACLSACGIEHYRHGNAPLLEGHVHVPFGDAAALAAAVDADTAAILLEPIQSVGGLNTSTPEFYRAVGAIAAERAVPLIFDEVQTGLGRTGTWFFGEHFGVRPQIISLAKGIASGVPCGAVVVAPEIAATVNVGDQGSTFGGGPIAMAAMLATLETIEREDLVSNARAVGARLRARAAEIPGVVGVRGMGLLLGLELARPAAEVQRALLARRVIAGTSGNARVLRLLPPLTLSEGEADVFLEALAATLAA